MKAVQVDGLLMKTCSKCGKTYEQPEKHFHKRARSVDGLRVRCKPCAHQAIVTDYIENRDYYIKAARAQTKKIAAVREAKKGRE